MIAQEQQVPTDVVNCKNVPVPTSNGKIRGSSSSSSSSKELLTRLIADEMITSFSGKNDGNDEEEYSSEFFDAQIQRKLDPVQEASKKSRKKSDKKKKKKRSKSLKAKKDTLSSTEIPYASDHHALIDATSHTTMTEYYDDIDMDMIDEFPEDDSFAGLELDHLVEDDVSSRRSSLHSRTSTSESDWTAGSSIIGNSTGVSNNDETATNGSGSEESGELSVEEVLKYVKSQMPESVKSKIPAEAWCQIFGIESNAAILSGFDDDDIIPNKSTTTTTDEESATNASDMVVGGNNKTGSFDIPMSHIVIEGIQRLEDSVQFAEDEKNHSSCNNFSTVSDITGASGLNTDSILNISKRSDMTETTEEETTYYDESTKRESQHQPTSASTIATEEDQGTSLPSVSSVGSNNNKRMVAGRRSSMKSSYVTTSQEEQEQRPTKIKFDLVEIRLYERSISYNPGVQNGPAIGIGWRYKRGGSCSVDEYESRRARCPRSVMELILTRQTRETMLLSTGYTKKDIADSVRSIYKAKNNRKQTVANLKAQGMELAIENASRKVKRILTFGKKKDLIKKKNSSF